MEKTIKTLKIITVILIVLAVTAISFLGIYKKVNGVWTNVLKEYTKGMELGGYRELRYVLSDDSLEQKVYVDQNGEIKGLLSDGSENDTDESTDINLVEDSEPVALTQEGENAAEATEPNTTEGEANSEADASLVSSAPETTKNGYKVEDRLIKANEEADINLDNFNKSKKIIQTRLESQENYEYNIRVNNLTGEIIVEVPDGTNDDLNIIHSIVETKGKFQIVDAQTGVILVDQSNVRKFRCTYQANSEAGTYQAYMLVYFDAEGKEILDKISKEYVQVKAADGTTTSKAVTIKFDDSVVSTTTFGEELSDGLLSFPLGSATTDFNEFRENYKSVATLTAVLNSGELPLAYELATDDFVQSNILNKYGLIFGIVCAVAFVAVTVYFVIKYKLRGLLVSVNVLGYIAVNMLAIRYLNVVLTLNAVVAIVLATALYISFLCMISNRVKTDMKVKDAYKKSLRKYIVALIPVIIGLLIFSYMHAVIISSIGLTLFVSLMVQLLYSLLLVLALEII